MASSAPPPDQEPSQLPTLQYKTWVLKVSIHCPGCQRKVKKVLQTTEGVYTTDIDIQQQKVIVTGNVEAETLIKKLIKNGRSAELWPEIKPPGKEKKPKQNDNSDDEEQDEDEDDEKPPENAEPNMINHGGNQKHVGNDRPTVRFGGVETVIMDVKEMRADERLPQNVGAVERFPATGGGGPGGGGQGGGPGGAKKKKKKKKKKSGNNNTSSGNVNPGSNPAPASTESEGVKMGPNQVMDQSNLSHPFPNPYSSYPQDQNPPTYYAPHQSYVVSYSAAHPTVSNQPAYYYIPSSPYAYAQSEVCYASSTPLDSFEIMSDENPNACYVM